MPYCPECGKSVAQNAKFCRNCGASQLEGPQPAPQAPAEPAPALTRLAQSPSPPPTPPPPINLCLSCRNPVQSSEKFCGNCGTPVVTVPSTPMPAPFVPAPVSTPPPTPSCSSCGALLSGVEKFCGVCGAAVHTLPGPASQLLSSVPPPQQTDPFTCSSCGNILKTGARFCNICGKSTGGPPSTASNAPAAPQTSQSWAQSVPASSGETVVGVIGNARRMKMLGASWDTFALVVTDRRMILAQLTTDRLTAAYKEAAEKAKAEGKGFFLQWADQIALSFQYCERYRTLPPDQTLQETANNRAIPNERITALNFRFKESGKVGMEYHEFQFTIDTVDGKFEFLIGEDDRFTDLLRRVYGDKVHMPSGYVSAGGVRIKFF